MLHANINRQLQLNLGDDSASRLNSLQAFTADKKNFWKAVILCGANGDWCVGGWGLFLGQSLLLVFLLIFDRSLQTLIYPELWSLFHITREPSASSSCWKTCHYHQMDSENWSKPNQFKVSQYRPQQLRLKFMSRTSTTCHEVLAIITKKFHIGMRSGSTDYQILELVFWWTVPVFIHC
jgi:hypothetical protein